MTKKKTNSNKPEEIRLKVTNWDEAVPTMICRDHGASASRGVVGIQVTPNLCVWPKAICVSKQKNKKGKTNHGYEEESRSDGGTAQRT